MTKRAVQTAAVAGAVVGSVHLARKAAHAVRTRIEAHRAPTPEQARDQAHYADGLNGSLKALEGRDPEAAQQHLEALSSLSPGRLPSELQQLEQQLRAAVVGMKALDAPEAEAFSQQMEALKSLQGLDLTTATPNVRAVLEVTRAQLQLSRGRTTEAMASFGRAHLDALNAGTLDTLCVPALNAANDFAVGGQYAEARTLANETLQAILAAEPHADTDEKRVELTDNRAYACATIARSFLYERPSDPDQAAQWLDQAELWLRRARKSISDWGTQQTPPLTFGDDIRQHWNGSSWECDSALLALRQGKVATAQKHATSAAEVLKSLEAQDLREDSSAEPRLNLRAELAEVEARLSFADEGNQLTPMARYELDRAMAAYAASGQPELGEKLKAELEAADTAAHPSSP